MIKILFPICHFYFFNAPEFHKLTTKIFAAAFLIQKKLASIFTDHFQKKKSQEYRNCLIADQTY